MFGNADRQSAPAAQGGAGRGEGDALLRALRAAGVEPGVCETPPGCLAGGAALAVPVATVLAAAGDEPWRRITELARAGVPATLGLSELGPGDAAIGALETFLRRLGERLAAEGLSRAGLGLSIRPGTVPLEAYRLLAAVLLGEGARYVLLDSLHMRPQGPRAEQATAADWRFLWRCRDTRSPLLPAYAAGVTTRCALLGDEAAGGILPGRGIQVPGGSAWLPLALDLAAFADGGGTLDWERLRHALEAAVGLGERLIDRLDWPDAELARDAAENRRLGIELSGLGDLVARRRADPSDLSCLRWLDGVVARVQALLWARSRALARERGALPSLLRSEPAIGWPCDRRRSHWQERWQRALAESAVRHRNLLVLSPYAVLPRNARRASDYLDLLPVLAHADAFAFADPPAGCFESAREYARFHRRAWAVMQRRHAASLVASSV